MSQTKTESSPLHTAANLNSTVSAAADSSDNQPPTPTPENHNNNAHQNFNNSSSNNSIYQANSIMSQEMHHPAYPSYMHSYDQFYHPPTVPSNIDYSAIQHQHHHQQQQQQQQQQHQQQQQQQQQYASSQAGSLSGSPSPHNEYKASRYHPYLSNGHHTQQQLPTNHPNSVSTNNGTTNPASSSISNSSLSPRVVSSSSPSHNSILGQNVSTDALTQGQRLTPAPPKQCDKCGFVCSTETQLSEHYASSHGVASAPIEQNGTRNAVDGDGGNVQSQFSYQPYIKEEPSSDILDLDSQKMVYPPQDPNNPDTMPPMHSMHPLHRPLAWNQDMHTGYMQPSTDLKQPYFSPVKLPYGGIKQEFPPVAGFGGQMIKSEYNSHSLSMPPQPRSDVKSFITSDIPPGNNPVSSSPAEFPSTTTPQENGAGYQRFEPPTSSLPNNPPTTKSAAWKSNEARRPKTYNCTACNKWFTSSGHLKRHYNTTLHKNAVKSSGQPDPATMPISAHHHPNKDPTAKHHRNSQRQQPPPAPPEPPTSPEYSPQYAVPSPGNGYSSSGAQSQHNFAQYHQTALNSTVNGHPNGLAGPSVHASQPRGLLTISNTESSTLDQEDQVHNLSAITSSSSSLSQGEDQYNNQHHQRLHQQQQSHQQQQHNHQLVSLGQQQSTMDCLSPSSSSHSSSNHSQLESSVGFQQTISPTLQQLQPHLQQLQLQQQQTHIISHHLPYREPHHLDTIFTTPTTMLHNIMEQQQPYIINHLAINTTTTTPITTTHNTITTIPSFQHLQQPADHQGNTYPTIIGNDTLLSNSDSIILGSFEMPSASVSSPQSCPSTSPPLSLTSSNNINNNNYQHLRTQMSTDGAILQIVPSFQTFQNQHSTLVELQRLSGGVPIYRERASPLYSPAVPETQQLRISPFTNQRSPQEADIPPPHSTASAPAPSFPYSPTISSSTITTSTTLTNQDGSKTPTIAKLVSTKKPSLKRPREDPDTPNAIIECVECDKIFAKACYLTQHNKTFHSGEQPFRCQKCGKRFKNEIIYEAHLARHKSQDKPFKCDLCPKQFHHKTDLRRHKDAIHTGFKAHTCDICQKGFCRKDHLRKHCDTHNRPKPVRKGRKSVTTDNNAASTIVVIKSEPFNNEYDGMTILQE